MSRKYPLIRGAFLPTVVSDTFRTLDGVCVASWLRANGYEVVAHYDTGSNGLAVTREGYQVSTSGWVCREDRLILWGKRD